MAPPLFINLLLALPTFTHSLFTNPYVLLTSSKHQEDIISDLWIISWEKEGETLSISGIFTLESECAFTVEDASQKI
jgi:hypothetical protein